MILVVVLVLPFFFIVVGVLPGFVILLGLKIVGPVVAIVGVVATGIASVACLLGGSEQTFQFGQFEAASCTADKMSLLFC